MSNLRLRALRRGALRFGAVCAVTMAIVMSAGCASGPQSPIDPPMGKSWKLAFDVEFDGTSLDTSKLTPCFDWNVGNCTSSFNDGREHYLPSQVRLSGGIAHLVAEPLRPPLPDNACAQGLCTYKAGLLSTARPDQSSPYLFSFTYGYVEARMKLPSTPGMFTAFWMLPARPDHRYDSEIDIVENLGGKPDVIYQTYHYAGRTENFKVNGIVPPDETNGSCPKLDYSNDFHTYGVDWQPDHVAFFIDGKQCGRFAPKDVTQISNEPMQIILDVMVDTSWSRAANLVLHSQTEADELAVDYLRVWQST